MSADRFTVAVVGAGAVGRRWPGYTMLVRGSARRIVLHDISSAKVRAEVLDLGHGAMFTPRPRSTDPTMSPYVRRRCRRLVTAGAKQRPGQSRMDLAGTTVELMGRSAPFPLTSRPTRSASGHQPRFDVVTYASLKIAGSLRTGSSGNGPLPSRLRWLVSEAWRRGRQCPRP